MPLLPDDEPRGRRAIGFRNAAKWRQLPARKTQTLPPGLYDAVVASTSWQHDTLLLDILVQQDSVPGEPPIRIRLPTYFTTTPKDIS